MKPKILIAVPTMGYVHAYLVNIILGWVAAAMQHGRYSLNFYTTVNVQPVDNARNEIVEEFLRGDSTHLLFIDSDTLPPLDAIEKMLAHDKDIVTGITAIVESDDGLNFYRKWNVVGMNDKHVQAHTGFFQAKACGSSFLLIKRKVFEGLPKPHYRFLYTDSAKGEPVIVSEDIHFTANATDAGFELWVDTELIAKHYKPTLW